MVSCMYVCEFFKKEEDHERHHHHHFNHTTRKTTTTIDHHHHRKPHNHKPQPQNQYYIPKYAIELQTKYIGLVLHKL